MQKYPESILRGIPGALGGKNEIGNVSLYWRFNDIYKNDKQTRLYQAANAYIKKRSLLKSYQQLTGGSENVVIKVDTTNYVVYQKVKVTVEKKYRIIMPGIMRLMGIGDSYTAKITAEAMVSDSAEKIRTYDFISDTLKMSGAGDLNGLLSDSVGNIPAMIQKFLGF